MEEETYSFYDLAQGIPSGNMRDTNLGEHNDNERGKLQSHTLGANMAAYVPFPQPGGPIITALISLEDMVLRSLHTVHAVDQHHILKEIVFNIFNRYETCHWSVPIKA